MTAMNQQTSEQLARLWTESQPVVAAYVLSIIPNFHQAEDVLQQVAVALVSEFERFDASRPFLPWVLGIARNMALKSRRDSVRRWKHELSEALIEQIESAFQEQDDSLPAMRRWLRYCLRKQPKKMLELLQWRYAHDLKPSEVAPRMGITSGAVRAMLHRSREALRKCIRRSARGALEWN
jgi:RNA polymerase sigma-70 factor (ECF subfamily)